MVEMWRLLDSGGYRGLCHATKNEIGCRRKYMPSFQTFLQIKFLKVWAVHVFSSSLTQKNKAKNSTNYIQMLIFVKQSGGDIILWDDSLQQRE